MPQPTRDWCKYSNKHPLPCETHTWHWHILSCSFCSILMQEDLSLNLTNVPLWSSGKIPDFSPLSFNNQWIILSPLSACLLTCLGKSTPLMCHDLVFRRTGRYLKAGLWIACSCQWHITGKWKVMQISDLITFTPLLYSEASSVSLAEECLLFLWLGYHLSLLSLEMSPLSCPRVPCFTLWKVEQCAFSPSLQTWETPLDMQLKCLSV